MRLDVESIDKKDRGKSDLQTRHKYCNNKANLIDGYNLRKHALLYGADTIVYGNIILPKIYVRRFSRLRSPVNDNKQTNVKKKKKKIETKHGNAKEKKSTI